MGKRKAKGTSKVISIRIDMADKDLLEQDAKKEHRNVSNFLVWCWKKWREKNQ